MLGGMLDGKVPPPREIQNKPAGTGFKAAVIRKDVKYFPVFFHNVKDAASVYCSAIRALSSSFRVKNGPVKHHRFPAAVRPYIAYFRRTGSAA
jgi:hypothetical protein